jgi:hypothetical protein
MGEQHARRPHRGSNTGVTPAEVTSSQNGERSLATRVAFLAGFLLTGVTFRGLLAAPAPVGGLLQRVALVIGFAPSDVAGLTPAPWRGGSHA